MSIEIIGIIILVALVVLFFVWRTVKTFIKLAVLGLIALVVIAALGWWNFSAKQSSTPNSNRPANTRRAVNR